MKMKSLLKQNVMTTPKTNIKSYSSLVDLKNMIKSSNPNSKVFRFTPKVAEYILNELNLKNRNLKNKKIIQYATDMANNNWLLTGETITFSNDGLLADGQNRLEACIRANSSFQSYVVFGINPEAFSVMDTGSNRDVSDVFTIMEVKNAVAVASMIRLYLTWKSGHTSTRAGLLLTNDYIKNYYLDNMDHELVQKSVLMGKSVNAVTQLSRTSIATLFYWASENGEEEIITQFYDYLREGFGQARSPQKVMMKRIQEIRTNPSLRLLVHDLNVMLCRSYYNFKNKKLSTKADVIVAIGDKLPLM
jgi:hypothetical protein